MQSLLRPDLPWSLLSILEDELYAGPPWRSIPITEGVTLVED